MIKSRKVSPGTLSSAPWLAEQNVDIKRNCFFFPDAKNVSLDLPWHSDWLKANVNPSCPTQSFFDLLSGRGREGVCLPGAHTLISITFHSPIPERRNGQKGKDRNSTSSSYFFSEASCNGDGSFQMLRKGSENLFPVSWPITSSFCFKEDLHLGKRPSFFWRRRHGKLCCWAHSQVAQVTPLGSIASQYFGYCFDCPSTTRGPVYLKTGPPET